MMDSTLLPQSSPPPIYLARAGSDGKEKERKRKREKEFFSPRPRPPASLFLSEIRVSPRAREERDGEGVGLEESVEREFTNAQTKQDGCNDSGISS